MRKLVRNFFRASPRGTGPYKYLDLILFFFRISIILFDEKVNLVRVKVLKG